MPTPAMGAPEASSAVAVSWTVSPRLVIGAAVGGVSETEATGGREGPPPPQATRTTTANGQARRSGIHPPSAGDPTGDDPQVEETFDRWRSASLHWATFH